MAVTAVKEYIGVRKDAPANFHGAQLTYIGWLDHLLFCAPFCFPFPADMPFAAIIEGVLPGACAAHPDFAAIDWSTVEWTKNGEPFTPDPAKSLAENGMVHKDSLTFRTPGLTGIKGSST